MTNQKLGYKDLTVIKLGKILYLEYSVLSIKRPKGASVTRAHEVLMVKILNK